MQPMETVNLAAKIEPDQSPRDASTSECVMYAACAIASIAAAAWIAMNQRKHIAVERQNDVFERLI